MPFFSSLLFFLCSLNPCWSFHRFRDETSFSRLTSVISGSSSSKSTCLSASRAFFMYFGSSSPFSYFVTSLVFCSQPLRRLSGTRQEGTSSEMVTASWLIFFLSSMTSLRRRSLSWGFCSKQSLRSGDLSIFFLKSYFWKRSTLLFPRVMKTSWMRQRKASSSFLLMGNSFTFTDSNISFQTFMSSWSALISSSRFSRIVMMKGLVLKDSNTWFKCGSMYSTFMQITVARFVSENVSLLQFLRQFSLKWLPARSPKIAGVAIRMWVGPPIHTCRQQNLRSIGFSWLYSPTPEIFALSKNNEYRYTSFRSFTSSSTLGFTNPNFRVTYRVMGTIIFSPTWWMCTACPSTRSTLGADRSSAGLQSTLVVFFIHACLKASSSAPILMELSWKVAVDGTYEASRLRGSPQPKSSRRSASMMEMQMKESFLCLLSLESLTGEPITMVLLELEFQSSLLRLTTVVLESTETSEAIY